MKGFVAVFLSCILIVGCSGDLPSSSNASVLYFGGEILTMEGDAPAYVEALVEQQGKIVFVGDKSAAVAQFSHAKPIDLQGKTLLPGFIDAHSHVHGVGFQASSANLLPYPDGEADSVEAIISLMKKYRDSAQNQAFIESSGWIIGFGYDDAQLDRYPTADDLDRVSIDKPVIIVHTSGHLSVVNNKGLALSEITAASKNPAGGHIRRKAGTQEPNGILEETAHFKVLFTLMGKLDDTTQDSMLVRGQEAYASYGYTTAQEGRATEDGLEAMIRAAKKDELLLDIVAYQDSLTDEKYLASEYYSQSYNNQFRIAGIKLSFDGSPQGKTAWLTHPYHVAPEGLDEGYKGYATFTDDKAVDLIAETFKNNHQVLVHANGDAAIDQFIASIESATKQYGNVDRRPVLIHGQTLRQDQIKKLVELKIFPSLFPMHTFYWGDWHAESVLGHPRADSISPTKSVLDAGLMFTSHHDAPVARPDSFRVIDATVNRTTRTGKVLGPEERVSVYTALKSMTEWAAYQHFEEGTKGTLSVGKQADFILLGQNPLKIKKQDLQDIKVIETIKAGETVFKR